MESSGKPPRAEERKPRDEAAGAARPKAQSDGEKSQITLHQRRFDSKKGEIPENLTVSPHKDDSGSADNSPIPKSRASPDDVEWIGPEDGEVDPAPDLSMLCEKMIKRLEGRDDVLSKRSRAVAFATKSTEEALDHLEKLYRLMDQLFALKEHNAHVLRRARDLEHLKNLQEIHRQIEKEMERAKLEDKELMVHNEAMNMDLEAEYGYTEALLDSMLAAGRSASVKRAGSKWKSPTQSKFRHSILRKQRSRSMGGEELESCPLSDKERLSVPQTLKGRRSSDLKVDKSKISKWTKVKAAFKWEKAHTGVGASGLVIIGPDEETPATPGSPLSLTPTSSLEELRGDNGVVRRGEVAAGGPYLQPPTPDETSASPSPNKLHKTPWGKMKDIIQTRKESVKKKQNRNSVKSFTDSQRLSEAYSQSDGGIGGLSNSESVEVLSPSSPRTPYETGNQHLDVSHFQTLTDDGSRKTPMLTVTMPSSEELARFVSSTQKNKETDANLTKSKSQSAVQRMDNKHQVLRKQRSLEFSHGGRPPVGRSRHDSGGEMSGSSPAAARRSSKWSKVKRAFLTSTSVSVPSSPNRHSAFFTDIECDAGSSGGEAGGVREEIARDYAALQARLRRELQRRAAAAEWQRGKIYCASRPVATEEQLSADFRKKLVAWQRMKAAPASARQPPPIPDRSDLSEDFLKKWDEWKRLKETGSVPAWSEEPAPAARRPQHEVLVQTSTGFFRFHGISRSFTRKLHEWEKARGIAPEASTSALLRAARGALPRAQSAGSVAAACELAGAAHHASSLSVNDVERLERDLAQGDEQEIPARADGGSDSEGPGAVLVEVEAEEVETAAPLVAVNPRHQRQTPVYKYDDSEPRHLLCESSECTPARSIPDAGLREAALAQLSEEVAYQQLFKGLRNINDRFTDVSKQIFDIKNSQPNKSYGQVTGRLKELEKRLARLSKEGDILKNSLKDRANEFHTLANKFKAKISSVMTNDGISDMAKRKKIIDLLVDLNEKVEFIVQKASERLKHAVQGDFSNTDCTEDLKEVLRKIEQIEAARKKSFDENNLCVSYAMQRAQYVQTESSWNEDNTDYSSDLLNALPPNYAEPKDDASNQIRDIPELNVRSEVKDFFKPITRSTDSLNHRKEDSVDSKGAKKKDSLDKSNSKKKLKSRLRIERQLSKNSESDTETDTNTVTIEIPRRKKLVRTRRSSDTFGITKQRSLEKATDSDSEENVFVLKLKSPRRSESNFRDESSCEVSRSVSQKILATPEEYITNEIVLKLPEKKSSSEKRLDQDFAMNFQPEEFEIQAEEERPSTPEIIVKTTRKIFSPVRRDSKGKPKAVIGFDLEEITSSIEKRRAENANKVENQLPDIVGSKQSIISKDDNDNNSQPKKEVKKSSESLNKKDAASKNPQETGYSVRKSSSTSDSLSYVRGFTPSPLQGRKLSKFRDERNINNSQELFGSSSIPSIKESSPVGDLESPNLRRSSGDRLGYNGKFSRRSPSLAGSPVLSRSNTPAASNSLPPLPSSPTTSRRDRPPVKETAPSIRIMIQKYNTKLNEEGAGRTSPVASSGSASPAWRSPGVDRRRPAQYPSDVRRVLQQGSVRNNPFFDREVQKSASASQIMKRQQSSPGTRLKFSERPTTDQDVTKSKDNISDASADLTPTSQKRLLKGILKSSSVGSLKTNSPSVSRRLFNNRIDINHKENEDNIHNESVQKAIAENIDRHVLMKQGSVDANKSKDQRNSESPQISLTNIEERKSRIKSLASGLKRKLSGESPKSPKSAPATPLGYKGDSPLRDLHRDSIERAIRLQRAKEQFLKSEPESSKSSKDFSNSVHDLRSSNRLSQISCDSNTSYEANSLIKMSPNPKSYSTDPGLIKSLSVGMINVDRITYDHVSKDRGCVSLPRDHTKDLSSKPSKFSLSNIASKFRKVRMRKSKSSAKIAEKDKGKDLNTVSKLCRQSLLINIKPDSSNRMDSTEAIPGPSRIIGSQTNLSIVSAGRTGSVIAVGDVENIFPPSVSRHDRSMSIPGDTTNEKPKKEVRKVSKV